MDNTGLVRTSYCFGHMNMKSWLRSKQKDSRGYSKIICGGCGKFIGWEKPQDKTKRSSKSEKANTELYQVLQ